MAGSRTHRLTDLGAPIVLYDELPVGQSPILNRAFPPPTEPQPLELL